MDTRGSIARFKDRSARNQPLDRPAARRSHSGSVTIAIRAGKTRGPASIAFAAVLSCGVFAGPGSSAPATIRRLDGTTITTAKAESFARETLAAAHVTGAQVAVLDRGSLVWSAAFGQRRREPPCRWTGKRRRGQRRLPKACSQPT